MLRLFVFLLLPALLDAAMVTRQKVLMGTFVSISVDQKDQKYLSSAFGILKNIENSLSSFDKNSPIYKLNHKKYAKLDNYSYEALKLSRSYYKETDGYFNIAVGRITKDIYCFGADERIASKKELASVSTSLNGLIFNKKEAIITDKIKIDLGGMGKGFGVDKISNYLQEKGVQEAIVALSGDIRCIGECHILINNPFDEDKPLATFIMKNSGVSTSGNYNRYIKETKYNHLINPKTKESQTNFISVTLISNISSSALDAYATAVSVMPYQKAYRFLQEREIAYIILQADKKLVVSKQIENYVRDLKFK